MKRILALTVLVLPVILAGTGIKYMRDAVFGIILSPFSSLLLQFVIGLFLFFSGLFFVAGFILHRDRKRNKVQSRFQK
ncbi:DUF2627 domain-containing protein [Bacillaceae bacterium Marseille-Q3522]|nr:DUF2627 domain-containing protein [Bacillaceae bacterium Marseille-Q3522]